MKLFPPPKPPYVWLDTLPDVNDEPQYVPTVERYAYCKTYEQLTVLEELLVPYGLQMKDVVTDLPRPEYRAIIDLKLPKDEHLAVDLRPYGFDNVLYFMTRRRFKLFKRNQAIVMAEDCLAL